MRDIQFHSTLLLVLLMSIGFADAYGDQQNGIASVSFRDAVRTGIVVSKRGHVVSAIRELETGKNNVKIDSEPAKVVDWSDEFGIALYKAQNPVKGGGASSPVLYKAASFSTLLEIYERGGEKKIAIRTRDGDVYGDIIDVYGSTVREGIEITLPNTSVADTETLIGAPVLSSSDISNNTGRFLAQVVSAEITGDGIFVKAIPASFVYNLIKNYGIDSYDTSQLKKTNDMLFVYTSMAAIESIIFAPAEMGQGLRLLYSLPSDKFVRPNIVSIDLTGLLDINGDTFKNISANNMATVGDSKMEQRANMEIWDVELFFPTFSEAARSSLSGLKFDERNAVELSLSATLTWIYDDNSTSDTSSFTKKFDGSIKVTISNRNVNRTIKTESTVE